MNKALSLLVLVITVSACTNESDMLNATESMGFKEVQADGYAFFDCSKDDFYHTKFIAKNQEGKTVRGVVCSGLVFKSSTVRLSR